MIKVLALLLALTTAAFAQSGSPTKQSGAVTPTHAVCWTTNGIIQDCGTAAIPYLSTIGTVGQGPTICANSAPVSVAFVRLCLAANTNSASVISVQNFGGATPQTLAFEINGTTYSFPFVIGGIVGPVSSVVNDVACWNNITGTLLQDCGTFPSSAPGGSNTNVQYNNNGAFGGYTNTQLTALINLATTSLSGALPAWPGNTSTYFRGDGSYATLNFTALGGSLASAQCPNATSSTTGCVKPDNSTIIVSAGVISAAAGSNIVPGGRLTLQSGLPIPSTDQTAATVVYYAPCAVVIQNCAGPYIPVYNGTSVQAYQFTSSAIDTVGLTLNLDTTSQTSGHLYDLFVGLNSGSLQLCTGPAWSSSTSGSSSRGTGAGTTQLALYLNIETNAVVMTCKFGASSSFSCPANQCTYVGTMLASANGQIKLQLHPAATSGGPNSVIGLCNAYNRFNFLAWAIDSTPTYIQSSTNTWINAFNSTSNRINFVSCLGTTQYEAQYKVTVTGDVSYPSAQGSAASIDVACSPTPSGGGGNGQAEDQPAQSASGQGGFSYGLYAPYPSGAGLHWVQACQNNGSGDSTFYGSDFMQLRLRGEL